LQIGDSNELPAGVAVILTKACFKCDGYPQELRRVYRDASGAVRSDLIAGPEDADARLTGMFLDFGASPDGWHLAAALCSRGPCGLEPSLDDQTEVYQSLDGGMIWQSVGKVDGVNGIAAVLDDGVVLRQPRENHEYVVYPSGRVIEPPPGVDPNAQPLAIASDELAWIASDHEHILDGSGTMIASGVLENGVDVSRSAAGALALVTMTHVPDVENLAITDGGQTLRQFFSDSYIGLGGWADERHLVVTFTQDPNWRPQYGVGEIDLDAGSFHLFSQIQAAGLPEYVEGVETGSFLRVAGHGDCVNVRDAPSLEATSLLCASDGVLLRDLGDSHNADGETWLKVRLPDGRDGWAAERWIER
jgi:hypothetical protein